MRHQTIPHGDGQRLIEVVWVNVRVVMTEREVKMTADFLVQCFECNIQESFQSSVSYYRIPVIPIGKNPTG